MKPSKFIESLTVILIFIICIFSFPVYASPGSISGIVIPNDTTIRVQLIQNLSWINETNISETGAFSFSDVPEGNYGLLFIWNKNIYDTAAEETYVYNDTINDGKYDGFLNITDVITVTDGGNSEISVNLNDENMDFIGDYFIVSFDKDTPENEVKDLIERYNCEIKSNVTILYVTYDIISPHDRPVLELIKEFRSEPLVKGAYYETVTSAAGSENEQSEENETIITSKNDLIKMNQYH